MTKEEYIKKMNEDNEWAPGWDTIEAEFSRLYPGQEPAHFGKAVGIMRPDSGLLRCIYIQI